MRTSNPLPLVLGTLLLVSGSALADQVVTTLPAGDGKAILENPKNPGADDSSGHATGALVVDSECAKKTMKGARLNQGAPNPAYEACVKEKIEKAKKKGSL